MHTTMTSQLQNKDLDKFNLAYVAFLDTFSCHQTGNVLLYYEVCTQNLVKHPRWIALQFSQNAPS